MEFTTPEKEEIVRRIGMNQIISEPAGFGLLRHLLTDERRVDATTLIAGVRTPRRHPPGFERIHAAFIRFTSGTTAAAKGVVLSHETIRERIDAANQVL